MLEAIKKFMVGIFKKTDEEKKFKERMELARERWSAQFGSDTRPLLVEREKNIKAVTASQFSKRPYRQTIAVIGWGGYKTTDQDQDPNFQEMVEKVGKEVGEIIAECGMNILTGGGACVMRTALEGFINNNPSGSAFAVRPPAYWDWEQNPSVIYFKANLPANVSDSKAKNAALGPATRNHVNILCADKVIVLYGEKGTRAEAKMCGADWYHRKAVAIDFEDAELAQNSRHDADISDWKKSLAGIPFIKRSELKEWLSQP